MTVPTGTPGSTGGRAGERADVADVSLGKLFGNVSHDLSTLMRQEVALAKAEIKAEATKAGKGAGMLAGAGLAGWLAALIVAVLWAVIGGVLFATGRRTLRTMNPTPERTVDTVKQVPDALKGNMT
jgi:hypothetical protein